MPRPSKSVSIIKLEKNKDRRTKQQIAIREAGEKELLTDQGIVETAYVKADKVAHKEFLRLKKLLKAIEKDDEIYGEPTRRYCLVKSRLISVNSEVDRLKADLEELRDSKANYDDLEKYYKALICLETMLIKKENVAKSLRAEMDNYEKQNCMTIRSALAAIPKKPETKTNSLKEALGG